MACQKNLYTGTFKWFLAVLSGQKQLCVFLRNKYGFQIGNAKKKQTLFWPGRNAQNGLILHAWRFLDMPIPMAQVLRMYIHMALSYGLYVCIILKTAHHRTTFGIFCNFTQKTILEESSQKMFHISSSIVPFCLWEGQWHFLGDKDQIFIWGGQKEGVRGRYGGRSPKWGLFLQNPHIKQDTKFISQTFGQTKF